MALDPYAPCPCGSGKKFKWCCQPIHVQIDRAYRQDAEGQHESALRIMEEVTTQHPGNPEAWGRHAQLLYQNDRAEDAEAALQKALEINPNYPFGHLLQGRFRQFEGEIPGALMLYRRAAELYDPEARDVLGSLYEMIGECELKLNRPVAARAALQMTIHLRPGEEELRKAFDQVFGEESRLPTLARGKYTFQSPSPGAAGGRREAWDRALRDAEGARLGDAVRAFTQLTTDDPQDAAAWYNLGLAKAWLGDNRGALEALDRYVTLEPDEDKAASTWGLGEVLRAGQGMTDETNYVEHSVMFHIRNPQPVAETLQRWQQERRLLVQQTEQQGVFTGVVTEAAPALTPSLAATQVVRVEAFVLLVGDHLRLWHTNLAALARVREDLLQKAGHGLAELERGEHPAGYHDVLTEAIAFPPPRASQEDVPRMILEHMRRYLEEEWIHRPLRSLNMIPPVDAAGHPVLRKKLKGAVQFLEDCAAIYAPVKYDFDGLRRKLGLLEPVTAAAAASAGRDVTALGAPELAALPAEDLSDDELEQAFQTSLKLDARDLAGRFARVLIGRPSRPERPDRFAWYGHLVQLALAEGDTDTALNYVNEGERSDCEQNEGRRRNDYELRRAQILTKRGETDEAQAVFERLIDRMPGELRYRGAAAEAMLSAKRKDKALSFAEKGLAEARKKNDRDSEEYFKELVAVAKR